MKLHKLISRTVLATALLGATIGGALVGINNVNAGTDNNGNSAPNTQGDATKSNLNNRTEGNNGTVQKYNTNTNVQDGYLTLDSVPTFNFGKDTGSQSNAEGQPTTLHLNNSNDGVLRITDYRNLDKNSYTNDPSQRSGWQLNVQIGNFTNTSNYNGNSGSELNQKDWTMHLNNTGNYHNLDYDTNNNGDASKAVFNQQSISPNVQNGGNMLDSTGKGNINSEGIGKGYGVNQITYNNSNDATLDIPNVPSGTYNADMTWTLSTPLTTYNTSSDS